MKTFVTDYYALNEVGRLCKLSGRIEAETIEEAERIGAETGHTVLGELTGEEEWDDGGFCDRVQKARDEDWLRGQENPE